MNTLKTIVHKKSLIPVFRLHINHCEFYTRINKFKWLLYTDKSDFKDLNLNNLWIWLKRQ